MIQYLKDNKGLIEEILNESRNEKSLLNEAFAFCVMQIHKYTNITLL